MDTLIWVVGFEEKYRAAIDAPMQVVLQREDTQVIERPGWFQLLTPSAPTSLNEVVLSQIDAASADEVIEATLAQYTERKLRLKWCVGPWTEPSDFDERLRARGFDSWGVRGMAIDCYGAQSDSRVIRVESKQQLELHIEAAAKGWGVPDAEVTEFARPYRREFVERPDLIRFYSVCLDDQVVGTAATVFRGDYVYLTGAQVLSQVRGRGLYRALIATRLYEAGTLGIGFAVTQARESTSAPRLEHLGFETVFRSRCYVPA